MNSFDVGADAVRREFCKLIPVFEEVGELLRREPWPTWARIGNERMGNSEQS